jgi:hypothetical protein
MLTIASSVVGTLILMLLVLNFRKPEKETHHKVERLFDIKSSQFKREMGALRAAATVCA